MSGPFSFPWGWEELIIGGLSIEVVPILAPPDAFAIPETREISKPSGFGRGLINNRFHDDLFFDCRWICQ